MSAQHTPGRLFVLPKHPDTFHAETPGGRGLRVGEASSCRTKAEDYANARRLVACWNACDGISTDYLEKHGLPDFAQKISDLKEQSEKFRLLANANAVAIGSALRQRDELLGLLAELMDTELAELACQGSNAPVEDLLGRIQAAIAKHQPPAAPAATTA